MRVLLTGATGNIGSYVLEQLVTRGDTVRVLALPETVEQVPYQESVEVIIGNLDEGDALAEATAGMDVVYHLAARLPGSEPQDIFRVNVQGTENLLCASVHNGVHRFVFTSSVAVYSPRPLPFMWPITEDSPQSAHGSDALRNYGQSKIDAEDLILRFHREHELEYVILRPTAIYGPGIQYSEQLLQRTMRYPQLALSQGRLLGTMQWVHVKDLAEAVILAGTRAKSANEAFNVAGGEAVTMWDITAAVSDIMGSTSRMDARRLQARQRGNYSLRFDISKAQAVLGYTPQMKLQEGLEEMLAAMDERRPFAPWMARPLSRRFMPAARWGTKTGEDAPWRLQEDPWQDEPSAHFVRAPWGRRRRWRR
jgi:nucleoside-diphosphate-sugar epimerase